MGTMHIRKIAAQAVMLRNLLLIGEFGPGSQGGSTGAKNLIITGQPSRAEKRGFPGRRA
jgi:hypothetical protein